MIPTYPLSQNVTEVLRLKIVNICSILQLFFFISQGLEMCFMPLRKSPEANVGFTTQPIIFICSSVVRKRYHVLEKRSCGMGQSLCLVTRKHGMEQKMFGGTKDE